jgi:hypothetical protein
MYSTRRWYKQFFGQRVQRVEFYLQETMYDCLEKLMEECSSDREVTLHRWLSVTPLVPSY